MYIKSILSTIIVSILIKNVVSFDINYKLVMELSNIDHLHNYLMNISDPKNEMFKLEHKFYSAQKIEILTRPNEIAINAIKSFTNENNIHCKYITGYFACVDDYKLIENIFKVKIKYDQVGNDIVYSAINDYTLPDPIKDHVLFITGLTPTFEPYQKHKFNRNKIENNIKYVGREVQDRLYNGSVQLWL